jgi:hypothetical protein
MKKKTKRLIFYFSVLVFIVLSWLVVLFALGYKYDFVQNKFFKTGSLAIDLNTEADIYINDNLAGKTSFLGNSFSQSRLLPRTYNIRAQNNKYQSWDKLANVEAGFLTSFPNVVLLPKDFQEKTVASSSLTGKLTVSFDINQKTALFTSKNRSETITLQNGEIKIIKPTPTPVSTAKIPENSYILSPDNSKQAWLNDHEILVKWLKDSGNQPLKHAGDMELVTRFSQTVSDLQWYKDSEHLIVNVGLPGQGGIIKFIEIDTRGGINIFDITSTSGPFYYDRDLDAVFKIEGTKLIRINLKAS